MLRYSHSESKRSERHPTHTTTVGVAPFRMGVEGSGTRLSERNVPSHFSNPKGDELRTPFTNPIQADSRWTLWTEQVYGNKCSLDFEQLFSDIHFRPVRFTLFEATIGLEPDGYNPRP